MSLEKADLSKLDGLRRLLVKRPELWHFDLFTSSALVDFASNRGIDISGRDTAQDLWRAGLIRADIVLTTEELNHRGLELVSAEDGEFLYCDQREVEHRSQSYGSVFQDQPFAANVKLFFHPFRAYALFHVARVFQIGMSSVQYLMYRKGARNILNLALDDLDRFSSTPSCATRFNDWNCICDYAIALEPISYSSVFHTVRWKLPDTRESIREKRTSYKSAVCKFLSAITAQEIDKLRDELCRDAQYLDDNKVLHVLLRLMSTHERLKIKSALGGALLFLNMAEIIRRAMEDATNQSLREEDELGFGTWMDGARQSIFGSTRILDAAPGTQRDFLTSMGLDLGVKVRCYVEGETELGALESAVGSGHGIEFVNLRARFVEGGGKGLSFADSLKNDQKSKVFSVVVLDGDRRDNIRVVRKAAKDELFFGRFFIAAPDFEFQNFTAEELVQVVLSLTGEASELPEGKPTGWEAVIASKSAKDFFDAISLVGISDLDKGVHWGKALMRYGLQNQEISIQGGPSAKRQLIEIAKLLVHARSSGYERTYRKYRVDPETGQFVERAKPENPASNLSSPFKHDGGIGSAP